MKKLHILLILKKGLLFILQNKIVFIPAAVSVMLLILGNTDVLLQNPILFIPYFLISLFVNLLTIRFIYERVKADLYWKRIFRFALCKLIPILVAAIIYGLLCGIASVVLIIPGIFLFIKFSFFANAIILDNEGIIRSLKKS